MPVSSEFLMSCAMDRVSVFVQAVGYPFEPGYTKRLNFKLYRLKIEARKSFDTMSFHKIVEYVNNPFISGYKLTIPETSY
jgi:hypothetical protein